MKNNNYNYKQYINISKAKNKYILNEDLQITMVSKHRSVRTKLWP